MRCADDPGGEHAPLDERTVTGRTAELCRAAEEAHAALPAGSPAPLYVIGTEVPVPGGEQGDWQLAVTRTEDLQRTIDLTREAFLAKGLQDAWQRVIAVVVQPGVEFGDTAVIEYDREKARDLSAYISRIENLVYEAHSTDYQTREALRHLVEDHFAVLKVGPWLTFAFREAVFALDSMEAEWLAGRKGIELSSVRQVLDAAMLADPRHWKRYYRGDESAVRFARKYSYSDRSRYYWMQPAVQAALQKLLANLAAHPFPATLLSQHMPEEYEAVREDRIAPSPSDLIRHRIAKVLRVYSHACTPPAA
jgi:D-tagatose-1,6-bisphosphate aldolase subunit GatZ/KbaZ